MRFLGVFVYTSQEECWPGAAVVITFLRAPGDQKHQESLVVEEIEPVRSSIWQPDFRSRSAINVQPVVMRSNTFQHLSESP